MAVIETMTFRLRPDAEEAAFLDADRAVQSDFAYQQPGLLRRTTARGEGGSWIVIDLWESAAEADAMAPRWNASPVATAFLAFVDDESVVIERYETLG